MAVYERTWRRYEGPQTPVASRFLVIARFALRDVFASRAFTAFYVLCALPTLVTLVWVYVYNLGSLDEVAAIRDAAAKYVASRLPFLFWAQSVAAFFVAIIVTPSLIAADLSGAALPLYLSRPISRPVYLAGKMTVLAVVMSPITWLGGSFIYLLQATLAGGSWWRDNLYIASAFLIGHVTWIVLISLVTLAISLWVRHKALATGALFAVFFVLGGFSQAVNFATRSELGNVFSLPTMIVRVVHRLLSPGASIGMPVWLAWTALATWALLSLIVINYKLRAHEVVT